VQRRGIGTGAPRQSRRGSLEHAGGLYPPGSDGARSWAPSSWPLDVVASCGFDPHPNGYRRVRPPFLASGSALRCSGGRPGPPGCHGERPSRSLFLRRASIAQRSHRHAE